MLQELQELKDKMTAVAESTVNGMAEVAKESKKTRILAACRICKNNPVMVQELQELTEKMAAVAEWEVDYTTEVAKDSKQDTSEFEKDSKHQSKNCGSFQNLQE